MRISIACIGRLKAGPEKELCGDYLARATALGRAHGITAVDLRETEEKKKGAGLKDREAGRLLSLIPANALVITLDEKGRAMKSEDFAALIGRERDSGTEEICFVIGGADGHGEAIRTRATKTLALGPQTWPHMLARVLILEQIYRAVTILASHPYHRA